MNEAGQPYTPGALTNMWHRLTKAAGVRPIRLHDARHSCGTALHLRAVPTAVIAKWLGHADASITANIYAHSQDDVLREASATLGRVSPRAVNSAHGFDEPCDNVVTATHSAGRIAHSCKTSAQVSPYVNERARRDSNPQPSDP